MTRRPILDPTARVARLELRLTVTDREAIDRAAAAAHASSASEWARQVLLSAANAQPQKNRRGQ